VCKVVRSFLRSEPCFAFPKGKEPDAEEESDVAAFRTLSFVAKFCPEALAMHIELPFILRLVCFRKGEVRHVGGLMERENMFRTFQSGCRTRFASSFQGFRQADP
jgi:hypothetical protein